MAVDDFGTGYSNFSYLRKFPADALKVDRSFIHEIFPESGNAAILNAMIHIGKSLGHRVVAEGVETQSQLDFLQQSGCTERQGYFCWYPVIADKFAENFWEQGCANQPFTDLPCRYSSARNSCDPYSSNQASSKCDPRIENNHRLT